MTTKPEPVPQTVVCSLCSEPWADHGDDPDATDCVRLLLAKIARTPTFLPATPQPWTIGDIPDPWPGRRYDVHDYPPTIISDHTSDAMARQARDAATERTRRTRAC